MASFGMEGKLMAKSRKDQRGRVLRKGESQRSSDGRYVYQYTDGMGKRRSIYARDLMTLREKEKRLARDSMDGLADYVNRRTTLNYVFDRYISTKYDLKEQTKVNYKYTYDHFVRNDIGRLLIKEIRYSDMKKFYLRLLKEKGIKGNTLGNVYCVLHPTFDMAVRDDIIRKNPTDNLMKEFKKMDVYSTGVRHALTSRQQKIFLDYVEADSIFCRWFPILTVLFGTGMRIGECLGLRWEDIDLDNRTIHVNHTLIYREMVVNISTNAANILFHRFYRLICLYFIKSRHIFRDLITYFSRRSDGRSRRNRKSDLLHGGRDDHTGHWG